MPHAADCGDGWMPIDVGDGKLAEKVGRFHEMLAERGKVPADYAISVVTFGGVLINEPGTNSEFRRSGL